MHITRLEQSPGVPVTMTGAAGVTKQVPISKADGAPNFVFRVFTLAPGGYTPFHAHPAEHANYIISGSGAVVNEQGEEKPLRAGDFVLVMPEEKHQYRNASGDRPFVMICAVPKEYE